MLITIALLAELAGAAEPEPTFTDVRVVLRGVAETWVDGAIGTVYGSGALSGGAAFVVGLPRHLAVDLEVVYERKSPPAVEGETSNLRLDLLPISALLEVQATLGGGPVELFAGAGPAVTVYTEHHDPHPATSLTVTRGARPALEARLGLRVDTGLVDPPMAPAPSSVQALEIEVYAGRRMAPAIHGFNLNAWRGGVGLALRF